MEWICDRMRKYVRYHISSINKRVERIQQIPRMIDRNRIVAKYFANEPKVLFPWCSQFLILPVSTVVDN